MKMRVTSCHCSYLMSFKSIHLQRYGIAPPTEAEVAAVMQHTSGNEADRSMQQGHPAPGTQGPQTRTTQTQGSGGDTGEFSCEVRCCELFISCGRPRSHQL
ncbi:hypothetical protein BDR03DRAFT_44953 [Suillus americanus]|nr:hypothetical protein BDR03DRAFT_44953 [Suillus americanus]